MLSSPKETYHQHNDCYDEQNMDEPAHRVTAYQPQQPEYHEYHKNRPNHCNLLLLYEALPHVRTLNPTPYPSPKGEGLTFLSSLSICLEDIFIGSRFIIA